MINKTVKFLCFVLYALLFYAGSVHAFNEEAANTRWHAVKGTPHESVFLMELFINERMPGRYPWLVKQRFKEVATPRDAAFLLDQLIDPGLRKAHTSVFTLLRLLKGDEYVSLFEDYFYRTSNKDTRNKLFNLITQQNSAAAFSAAIRIMESLQTEPFGSKLTGLLNYMVRFDHPDIRDEAMAGAFSPSDIVRAASYVTLRNYPDKEVESVIDDAIVTEDPMPTGRKSDNIRKKRLRHELVDETSLIMGILRTTKEEMERNKNKKNIKGIRKKHKVNKAPRSKARAQSVTARSSDRALAEAYAPRLRLSGPGAIGVNLNLFGLDYYPYTDYIPIDVNDVTSNPNKPIKIYLSRPAQYRDMFLDLGFHSLPDGEIERIGSEGIRSSSNYLDFSPLWKGIPTTVESGYKTLSLNPTVYFRVFRDAYRANPIAVQYWFFYFYNDWLNNHPGDWETITVFLDSSARPSEVAYSTHHEANRYSWQHVEVENDTHPNVYISNGGHGSYVESGNTRYKSINDNHMGDKEILSFVRGAYKLVDLGALEWKGDSWVWFEGRWGDQNSAPRGPRLRTDVPNYKDRVLANHPPYNPYDNCSQRYAANIYGDSQNIGPWFWASGYGLDMPWESKEDCQLAIVRLSCGVVDIALNQTVPGTWEPGCTSMHRSTSYYAKYYAFTLTETQDVTIDLQSSRDTYLFLLRDSDKSIIESDDDGGVGYNSQIVRTLPAGKYVIEATTYNSQETGDFGISIGTPPPPSGCGLFDIALNQTVPGSWEPGCMSTHRSGRYAQYYTFTLTDTQTVTVELKSPKDTYLYLLSGSSKEGKVIEKNDDKGNGSDSQIVILLAAGTYTIEATTFYSDVTGGFSISVAAADILTIPEPAILALISIGLIGLGYTRKLTFT